MIKSRSIVLSIIMGLLMTGAINAQEPPTYSAYDLQTYNGVIEGDRVRFIGVVTIDSARYGYSITVACDETPVDPSGEYNGISIYDMDQRLDAQRGDLIEVVGILMEYYDKTEIVCSDETEFPPVVTGSGPIPEPFDITCMQADSEPYENVLIRLTDVEVLSNPDQYGNIDIACGGDSHMFTMLLRLIDPPPHIGYVYPTLIGDDDYHFGEFKIRPLDTPPWFPPPPTSTPVPTVTPEPTPTSQNPRVEIWMPAHDFPTGSTCECTVTAFNPTQFEYPGSMLFVVLDVYNTYYFYPDFGENPGYLQLNFLSGMAESIVILPPFTVQEDWTPIDGLVWYAAILDANTRLLTPIDTWTWEFGL